MSCSSIELFKCTHKSLTPNNKVNQVPQIRNEVYYVKPIAEENRCYAQIFKGFDSTNGCPQWVKAYPLS